MRVLPIEQHYEQLAEQFKAETGLEASRNNKKTMPLRGGYEYEVRMQAWVRFLKSRRD